MLSEVALAVTGNKADKGISNSKMLQVGIADQRLTIHKQKKEMDLNAFGVTANTYYQFEKMIAFVLQFGENLKKTSAALNDKISPDTYLKFIKNVEQVQMVYPNYNEEEKRKIKKIIDSSKQRPKQQNKVVVDFGKKVIEGPRSKQVMAMPPPPTAAPPQRPEPKKEEMKIHSAPKQEKPNPFIALEKPEPQNKIPSRPSMVSSQFGGNMNFI